MALRSALIAMLAVIAGCREPDCLSGGDCAQTAPCARLEPSICDDPSVRIDEFRETTLSMRNSMVELVIDFPDEPHDLAPTGGNIIAFTAVGESTPVGLPVTRNDVNLIYQLAGILPEDAFAYSRRELMIDDDGSLATLELHGTLAGRPEVEVATRYEIHPCEPGVRVRSELRNRSADTQVFFIADAAHWGKRRVLPFTPVAGQGWVQPELDLIELEESWGTFPYVAARAADPELPPEADPNNDLNVPTYGFVRCDADRLEGVNDPEITALGTARTLVRPGESLVYERFLMVTFGPDLSTGLSELREIRNQLHGDPAPSRMLRGRVVSGAGDRPLFASLVVGEQVGGQLLPSNSLVPSPLGVDRGSFEAPISEAAPAVEVWSFGRRLFAVDGPAGTVDVDLGDLVIPEPGLVNLSVSDAAGPRDATVVFQPADAAERARLTGTFHGRFTECAPWLGPPHGASPACNRVLVAPEGTEVFVPAGRYVVYATAGLDHSLARQELTVAEGETYSLDFALQPIDLRPAGRLWADLHVHGRASFDSSIPDDDRVRSFVAAGVEVIAATDHDHVNDYSTLAAAYRDRLVVMGGLETTQLIPWMDVPGDDFPRVIGHFNFWPLAPQPFESRGGAPWDELVEPGELFDLMAPLVGDDGMMMMNHPWDDTQFGRDLGYLRAINFDPRRAIPGEDDGTAQGMLVRQPAGGHRNVDFDVIEVINGAGPVNYLTTRPLWFSLLSQGYVKAGAANSDSHGLTDAQLGYARTLVDAGTSVADFDEAAFNRAVRDGRTAGVNGVVVLATLGRTERFGPSLAPYVPVGDDWIDIEVRAPPWIPVTEVRISTAAGTVVIAQGGELSRPADPFGTDGVVRIRKAIDLDEVLPGGADGWIVIEAGVALPPVADLDDDGVPDTGDNNGDGDIDELDIEEGEDSGPLEAPPDPSDPDDPRFVCTQVIPGMWPSGFAGPFLVDRTGDGWTPPGVAP